MIQPEALKSAEPLVWSPGIGTDVWALFVAAAAGDLETVRWLLAKDPALVRAQHAYRTPLYFAVREDRREVAEYLLDHGADPIGLSVHASLLEICRDRGYRDMESMLEAKLASRHRVSPRGEAVARAIRGYDPAAALSLIDAEPDLLHLGDDRGNRPIHWAVMTRQLDLIDELLRRGADPNAPRPDGARPIQLVAGDYHFRGRRDVPAHVATTPAEVLEHLRARGAEVDLNTAAAIGDLGRVRELLDRDPSLANRTSEYVTYYVGSGSPLRNAAERGHLEAVTLLLARGADPNLPEEGIAPHGHALYAAAANGHHEIARLLLEHGAYPSPAVESSADALSRAILNHDDPMIELLCSYGSHRSVEILAYYGDVKTAAAVLAANPALADDPVALENAVEQGNEAFVRLMLRHQPDLARRIGVGVRSDRPMDPAKARALLELLFRHGMDPSHPDWLHITPLHRFARAGDLPNATLFLDHGADLHARDEDLCSTPLGWAARFGQSAMVDLLLERGARCNLPDDPPWATPLAWAERRGHAAIAATLRRHGAR